MVIGAFPAAKLGALLIRQVSKPIANSIISQAKSSPIFRKYICMPPAQFYNWCEIKTKMWILNLGKPVNIPVLNEQMAIELGANLLGEAIIFVIAAGVLTSEYYRSARKEASKDAAKKQEMESLTSQIQELTFQLEQQSVQIKELFRHISYLDTPTAKPQRKLIKRTATKTDDGPPSLPSNVSADHTPSDTSAVHDASTKSNLLTKAINIVEFEFLNNTNPHREAGVLTLAINHLYRNVYELSLSMC